MPHRLHTFRTNLLFLFVFLSALSSSPLLSQSSASASSLSSLSPKLPPPPSTEEMNSALGIPLFSPSSASLWNEAATAVASRLKYPLESKTKTSSGFRRYASPPTPILSRLSYCQTLLAESDSPTSVSFIFANKGDSLSSSKLDKQGNPILTAQAIMEYKTAITNDSRSLFDSLSKLLGKPSTKYSGASAKSGETIHRWDWQDHSFLLSSPRDEYVALRIVPSASLDETNSSRIDRKTLQTRFANSLTKRPNGDIVITEIPMVDQGPKGFCVPATWERLLRYSGILSADMYLLAMAGNTAQGGGTAITTMVNGAKAIVQLHGMRVEPVLGKLSIPLVSQSISLGIPLVWSLSASPDFLSLLRSRPASLRENSDRETSLKSALSLRQKPAKLSRDPQYAHQCLITGYNPETREIAVSNSWGPSYAENWILIEEAEKIDLGSLFRIVP